MEKICLYSAFGVVGGIITALIGAWNTALWTLSLIIAIDYVTGFAVAARGRSDKSQNGYLCSKAGGWGLFKKGLIFAVVILAHRIGLLVESDLVRDMVILFYIANEAISIIENCKSLGIPVPKVLVRVIDALKDRSGEDVVGEKKTDV